ncbi:ParA family protein [Pseudomonas syringae]|uniref:ParA family protein n=1 Tax=Pseudomonas syringae TaxID=317 RepID=UPI0003552C70|nr:ParA family protein [Pseudomonas syringae]EPM83126.1 DNA-binding protein, putative plasmid partition protein [Pseudomonas syringae pv. actinidiae ICMP 19068]
MAIIAVLQQKGGVTKSTLARAIATEAARAGLDTLLADIKSTLARAIATEAARAGLDTLLADINPQQQTSYLWSVARDEASLQPRVDSTVYHRSDKLIREAEGRQLVVVDGGPHASNQSLEIAKVASVIVIPTGVTKDDLREALKLGTEFVAEGVPRTKLLYILSRTPQSDRELDSARSNIEAFGFACATGSIPLSTGYGAAMDLGLAITETRFKGLNDKALSVVQQVFNHANNA